MKSETHKDMNMETLGDIIEVTTALKQWCQGTSSVKRAIKIIAARTGLSESRVAAALKYIGKN